MLLTSRVLRMRQSQRCLRDDAAHYGEVLQVQLNLKREEVECPGAHHLGLIYWQCYLVSYRPSASRTFSGPSLPLTFSYRIFDKTYRISDTDTQLSPRDFHMRERRFAFDCCIGLRSGRWRAKLNTNRGPTSLSFVVVANLGPAKASCITTRLVMDSVARRSTLV